MVERSKSPASPDPIWSDVEYPAARLGRLDRAGAHLRAVRPVVGGNDPVAPVGGFGAGRRGGGIEPPVDRLCPPGEGPEDLRSGMIASGLLHCVVLAAILLGLPEFLINRPPVEAVVAVKLINVADFTRATQKNIKPVKEAKPDAPPVETPSPKPEPPKKDPLIPPPPAPPPPAQQAKIEPQAEPPKPEPVKPSPPPPPPVPVKPEPRIEPPKVEPPKAEPPKPEPKVEPPKPKPDLVKPKAEKPKEDQNFDQLLKNLAKAPEQVRNDEVPKPRKPQQTASASPSAQPNAPLGSQLTTAERDLVTSQLEGCWSPPAGAKDARNLRVEVLLQVGADGVVQTTQIVDTARYASDPFWRAAAESARRATLNPKCNKLILPPGKYEEWKTIHIFFDPKDIVL